MYLPVCVFVYMYTCKRSAYPAISDTAVTAIDRDRCLADAEAEQEEELVEEEERRRDLARPSWLRA